MHVIKLKGKKCGLGKKVRHYNCAGKYILIELSDLIGFVYERIDTQDGLKCCRMGFIFCGKHAIGMTRIQVSNPGPKGPLAYP